MDDDLRDLVASLAHRVARLEEAGRAAGLAQAGRAPLDAPWTDTDVAVPEHGYVSYAGNGPWQSSAVVWQVQRSWGDVVAGAGEAVAGVLSALGSAIRVRIVGELVSGAVSTGDLAARLEQPSAGQLFHHLRELMAAGIVHQPQRGFYALRPQHVIPVLAVLSAASDLAAPSEAESA